MKIFGRSIIRLISPNIKVMAIPVAVLLVVAILFIYLTKVGYSRVTKQISEYKLAQKTENILSGKLGLLKKVESEIADDTDSTILALPDKNPATWSISQLRLKSIENGLTMDSINVANSNSFEENINSIAIGVQITGQELAQILSFLSSLPTFAPISTTGEIQMEKGEDGGWAANTEVSIYWSKLPPTLPAIDETLNDLSNEEKTVLNKVSSLTKPTFTVLEPSGPKERLTPFN